jgi:hypothetical protein
MCKVDSLNLDRRGTLYDGMHMSFLFVFHGRFEDKSDGTFTVSFYVHVCINIHGDNLWLRIDDAFDVHVFFLFFFFVFVKVRTGTIAGTPAFTSSVFQLRCKGATSSQDA